MKLIEQTYLWELTQVLVHIFFEFRVAITHGNFSQKENAAISHLPELHRSNNAIVKFRVLDVNITINLLTIGADDIC